MEYYLIFLPGFIYLILGVALLLNYMKRRHFVNRWIQDRRIHKAYFYYLYRENESSTINAKDSHEIDKLLNRIAGHNWLSYWTSYAVTFIVITIFCYFSLSHFVYFGHNYLSSIGISDDVYQWSKSLPGPIYYAAIGAYLWGFYEFLIRYRNQNWSAVIQHLIWLKIPISMIVSYFIFYKNESGEIASIIAFGIGAFPIEYLKKFVMNAAASKIGAFNKNIISSPKWESLRGITEQIVEKFDEQGVENVHQLASADPFKLHFNTNIEFTAILDYIDQSILRTYLSQADADVLYEYGLTGAIDMAVLYSSRSIEHQDAIAELLNFNDSIVNINSAANSRNRKIFDNLLLNIWEDSRVRLILELWNLNDPDK